MSVVTRLQLSEYEECPCCLRPTLRVGEVVAKREFDPDLIRLQYSAQCECGLVVSRDPDNPLTVNSVVRLHVLADIRSQAKKGLKPQ